MTKEREDIEIQETEELEEKEVDSLRYEITSYPSDMTLRVYYDKWKDGQLVIPEFQRKYVWDLVQASKLIESFLIGIPVPGIFLYKEQKTNKLLVIDGQQRIESVGRFFEERFGDRIFQLKNVRSCWEGKTYSELSEPDRYQLQDAILRATVVQQLAPDDHSSVYHIFERLNTGGEKLSPMEIRKCVYSGPFFNLLETLNRLPEWRVIIDKGQEDIRLRDVELVLRVLALHDHWETYDKPMKSFLNQYINKNRAAADVEGNETGKRLKNLFTRMCYIVSTALPTRPFHLRGRLNMGLMDSVMTTCAKLEDKDLLQLPERFKQLLDSADFIETVSVSTSDAVVLKKRFSLAMQFLLQDS